MAINKEILYLQVEFAIRFAHSKKEKKEVTYYYLNNYLDFLRKVENPNNEDIKNEVDLKTRVLFLTLPRNVVSITLPNEQQISRDVFVPKYEKKLRWRIMDLIQYRDELEKEAASSGKIS